MSTAVILGISLAVSAVSAGVSYHQSEQQKDAQEEYNKQLEEEALRQYTELSKQEADAIEQEHQASLQAQRDYLSAKGQVEAQAAATGTYGQSVDLAIEDLNTGLGHRFGEITQAREMQLDNIDTQAKNIQAGVAQQADYTITPPSYYQGFSSGLSTFGSTYRTGTQASEAYRQS